jgi:hypothetical protein
MNSTIIPVRLVSGAGGACPVHRPSSHGRATAAIGPDPVATLAGTAAALPRWEAGVAGFKLTTPAPVLTGVSSSAPSAARSCSSASRHSTCSGPRARLASGSVAQPPHAGRSTPLRACPVSGQVSARALVASSAARIVRRVLRGGCCSGSPAAGRPRTFRHTHGSMRLDARVGAQPRRATAWAMTGRRQDLQPQAAARQREPELAGGCRRGQ